MDIIWQDDITWCWVTDEKEIRCVKNSHARIICSCFSYLTVVLLLQVNYKNPKEVQSSNITALCMYTYNEIRSQYIVSYSFAAWDPIKTIIT